LCYTLCDAAMNLTLDEERADHSALVSMFLSLLGLT
jgi:hypothetical protein